MTVSAAAMAGALAIALSEPASPPHESLSPQTESAAAALRFLVRFQGEGPIARAARARDASAERAIAAQLERQSELAGLCFGGFAGRAEIVLRTCDAVAASDGARVQQRWLQRLRSLRGVAYAGSETAPLARAPD